MLIKTIPRLLTIIVLLFWSSCAFRKPLISDFAIKNANIPLFIQMPTNVVVFDHLSPLVYQALHRHFMRIGYVLVDQPDHGYVLHIDIKRLDQTNKLISPDIVLLHYTLRLELACTLFNFNHNVVAQNKFFFSSLISKPRNPILNSDFLDFEYKRLLERAAPKIEYYFRSYLINAFE